METPTSRSLKFLRSKKYTAAVVEQWQRFPDREAPSIAMRASSIYNFLCRELGVTNLPATPTPNIMRHLQDQLEPILTSYRRDLFNFCDIIAVGPGAKGTLYVQTTTRDNQSKRIEKLVECDAVPVVLSAGNEIHVHGWAQVGARGARKLWKVAIHRVEMVNGSLKAVPEEDNDYEHAPADPGRSSKTRDGQNSLFTQEEPF